MSHYEKKSYIKICPVCGTTFEAHHKARIYCSSICRHSVSNEKAKKRRGVGRPKKRQPYYIRTKTDQLCWSCQNACGGCSWSRSFDPIEGWEAKPTKIKLAINTTSPYTDSFLITACPEYIKDEKR